LRVTGRDSHRVIAVGIRGMFLILETSMDGAEKDPL
jgi:hypothetical protein